MKANQYKWLRISVFLLILPFSSTGQHATVAASHHTSDPVATHNMLVVGEKSVYLSHLPMFQDPLDTFIMPHRYQVILEVSFEKPGSNPQAFYSKDRQAHSAIKIYTLHPDKFILPTIISADPQHKALSTFNASVIRGHLEKLEQGEGTILKDVKVNVLRVVHFQKFDSLAPRPAQLEYLLFGKGQELFLTHLITAPPDFDQVMSVEVMDHQFKEEELAKGIQVNFTNTINSPSTRLKEKQEANGNVVSASNSTPVKIRVVVKREFYFEEGELNMPADFGLTMEEKKGGFH